MDIRWVFGKHNIQESSDVYVTTCQKWDLKSEVFVIGSELVGMDPVSYIARLPSVEGSATSEVWLYIHQTSSNKTLCGG